MFPTWHWCHPSSTLGNGSPKAVCLGPGKSSVFGRKFKTLNNYWVSQGLLVEGFKAETPLKRLSLGEKGGTRKGFVIFICPLTNPRICQGSCLSLLETFWNHSTTWGNEFSVSSSPQGLSSSPWKDYQSLDSRGLGILKSISQSIYLSIHLSICTHTQGKDNWSFLCHGNNWNIGLHEKSCSSANSFSHPSYIFLPPRYNGSNEQFVIKWTEN